MSGHDKKIEDKPSDASINNSTGSSSSSSNSCADDSTTNIDNILNDLNRDLYLHLDLEGFSTQEKRAVALLVCVLVRNRYGENLDNTFFLRLISYILCNYKSQEIREALLSICDLELSNQKGNINEVEYNNARQASLDFLAQHREKILETEPVENIEKIFSQYHQGFLNNYIEEQISLCLSSYSYNLSKEDRDGKLILFIDNGMLSARVQINIPLICVEIPKGQSLPPKKLEQYHFEKTVDYSPADKAFTKKQDKLYDDKKGLFSIVDNSTIEENNDQEVVTDPTIILLSANIALEYSSILLQQQSIKNELSSKKIWRDNLPVITMMIDNILDQLPKPSEKNYPEKCGQAREAFDAIHNFIKVPTMNNWDEMNKKAKPFTCNPRKVAAKKVLSGLCILGSFACFASAIALVVCSGGAGLIPALGLTLVAKSGIAVGASCLGLALTGVGIKAIQSAKKDENGGRATNLSSRINLFKPAAVATRQQVKISSAPGLVINN